MFSFVGPGEAGKSTLIKQMQLIHGENMDCTEKLEKIPYIRQNIFDSMVVSSHSEPTILTSHIDSGSDMGLTLINTGQEIMPELVK